MPAKKTANTKSRRTSPRSGTGWKSGRNALVTGASRGIGLELSTLLARTGYNLILVSRNGKALRETAANLARMYGISVLPMPADLSDPSSPERIFRGVSRAAIPVDILINNAGFGVFGPFVHNAIRDELGMMQVNMVALAHLTRLFLPDMVRRKYGRILNVASTAAFEPGPLMATYYATKAYVLSFSTAIAEELRGTGVTVSTLCPGPTPTGFQERAGVKGIFLMSAISPTVEQVARAGFEGMMKGKSVIVPGVANKIGSVAPRFAPQSVAARFVKIIQKGKIPVSKS